ncbi:hypothetical protein [Streptomyces sp. NPDC090022]|uniref:hypothetical protein n=1 Tax=Streptomyces sp. NPDC090022 TaxID=3365920 RepID=UPI0038005826
MVLDVGLSLGLLDPRVFTAMVLMTLITTLMTGPLLAAAGRPPSPSHGPPRTGGRGGGVRTAARMACKPLVPQGREAALNDPRAIPTAEKGSGLSEAVPLVPPLTPQALAILSTFTGYPDIPNGRPCGLWAYMPANASRAKTFAQHPDGHVEPLAPGRIPPPGTRTHTVDVPRWEPGSRRRPELYYAAIETNPTGIMVPSLPKGTQDLLARRPGAFLRVELGQKRRLIQLIETLGARPDLPGPPHPADPDPCRRRAADLNALHHQLVRLLLEHGFSVEIESPFEAAVRETSEEHGFDLLREADKVGTCRRFVGMALSKRSPRKPIEHFLYAVQVTDFDDTLPRISTIVEEKDPTRDGWQYEERGVFLTLDAMDARLRAAAREVAAEAASAPHSPATSARAGELRVARSRLAMLRRIERRLEPVLPSP